MIPLMTVRLIYFPIKSKEYAGEKGAVETVVITSTFLLCLSYSDLKNGDASFI